MEPTLRAACKKCGGQMKVIAQIPPLGGASGLLVFLCLDCDHSETMLVEAERWDAVMRRSDRTGG
jgi:hypothetical protein